MPDSTQFREAERRRHLVFECALALIGALDPEEIRCLSVYTYIDALHRAQQLAGLELLETDLHPHPAPPAGRLTEQELAEIEARARAGRDAVPALRTGIPQGCAEYRFFSEAPETILRLVAELRQHREEHAARVAREA